MGQPHRLDGFPHIPRQGGCTVGDIAACVLYLSSDREVWGQPAAQEELGNIKIVLYPDTPAIPPANRAQVIREIQHPHSCAAEFWRLRRVGAAHSGPGS